MADQVGTLLWEMRTAGGWTLGRLAQQAGISKMALSRWEAGTRQPRIPELESVLTALNADASQCAAVFACIKAPRAVQPLRAITANAGLGELPTGGDLLRALRFRKGLTQTQLAGEMGVTQATIARWEAGDRLPDTTQIQMLCYFLGASEEELIVLTTGRFSETSENASAKWSVVQEEIHETLSDALAQGISIPADLFYLSLEERVLRWAIHEEAVCPLLGLLYGWHAQFLRNVGRLAEVSAVAQKGLKFASPKEPRVMMRAVILSATGAVYGTHRIAPERGIQKLEGWLGREILPDFAAWMMSDMAEYAALRGQTAQSLSLLAQACRTAGQSPNPIELFLRRCDFARALLEAKRPCEALRILPAPDGEHPRESTTALLLWSEAHYQAGNLAEAHNVLQEAQQLITRHALTGLALQAETYAKRF